MQLEITRWTPNRLCISGNAEPDLVKSLARVRGAKFEYRRMNDFTISFPNRAEVEVKRLVRNFAPAIAA